MIHTRKQIIENQHIYKEQIFSFLENEISELKKELNSIYSSKEEIIDAKESLRERLKKTNPKNSIESLFLSSKNPYPKFYAWWDEEGQQVLKYQYENINDLLFKNIKTKK